MPGKQLSFLADAVIGAHGEFSEWVFEIVRDLVDAESRRACFHVDRFETVDFLEPLRAIYLNNYPSNQFVDAIGRGDMNVLFLSESPLQTLEFMHNRLDISTRDAIRSQTASAVANLAIASNPYSRILRRDTDRTVGQIVDIIADHLGLPMPHEKRRAIAQRAAKSLGPDAKLDQVLPVVEETTNVDRPDRDTSLDNACLHILEPMLAMAAFDPVRPVVWPTEVFTFHDSPQTPPPVDPSITGPSRNLYYGPYLYLPPAFYRVEVSLVFSDDISAVPFVIEVHSDRWLAKARVKEHRPGRYRGYFHLSHLEATSPVEIRLRNESPVARGHLSLVELLLVVESDNSL